MARNKVNPESPKPIDQKIKLREVRKPRKIPTITQEAKVFGVKIQMFDPFFFKFRSYANFSIIDNEFYCHYTLKRNPLYIPSK